MRKTVIILFSFFYFVSVSGINFNYHYCGGDLESIGLTMFSDEDGCCGGMEMEDGCCKDQNIEVKIKTDQKTAAKFVLADKVVKSAIAFFLTQELFNYNLTTEIFISNYHSPPPKPNNSLLALNCTLRI